MPRPDKVAQVTDVARRLEQANATVLTEYRGLSVGDLAELRRRLREQDAEYKIVKNTLTRLAARDAGVDLPDDVLTGPTAVTFCAGDPVAAAKVLKAFQREHPELQIKAGIVEGSLLDAEQTARLADLASREELLTQIAGMLGTLLAAPARLAQANLDKLARVLGAYRDQREEGGEQAEAGEPTGAEPVEGQAEPAEAGESAEPVEGQTELEASEPAEAETSEPAQAETTDESGQAEPTDESAESGEAEPTEEEDEAVKTAGASEEPSES